SSVANPLPAFRTPLRRRPHVIPTRSAEASRNSARPPFPPPSPHPRARHRQQQRHHNPHRDHQHIHAPYRTAPGIPAPMSPPPPTPPADTPRTRATTPHHVNMSRPTRFPPPSYPAQYHPRNNANSELFTPTISPPLPITINERSTTGVKNRAPHPTTSPSPN